MKNSVIEEKQITKLSTQILDMGLASTDIDTMFTNYCGALQDISIPLVRAHLAIRTLHPLTTARSVTWFGKEGHSATMEHLHGTALHEAWIKSPLKALLDSKEDVMHINLEQNPPTERFPVLQEIIDLGATDYIALANSFSEGDDPEKEWEDGMMGSFATNRPGGFSEDEINAIIRLQKRLALSVKTSQREEITRNIITAYMGKGAGTRVLNGQIKLGDGDILPSVIWFSDLRESTSLSEMLDGTTYIDTVNDYYSCTAGAVHDWGGDILRFVGDAVLAIFPYDSDYSACKAAWSAMQAAFDAEDRLAALNEERQAQGKAVLKFGLGLHVGEVMFGNIGIPHRIEFTVTGTAANEVAKIESLTKILNHPFLVSERFAKLIPADWRPLGNANIGGLEGGLAIYAPPLSREVHKPCSESQLPDMDGIPMPKCIIEKD